MKSDIVKNKKDKEIQGESKGDWIPLGLHYFKGLVMSWAVQEYPPMESSIDENWRWMGQRKVAWIWYRDDVWLQSAAKKTKAGTVLKFESNLMIGSERLWSELKVWRASVTSSWKQERDWLNHNSPQNRVTKGCGLTIPQWNRSVLHNPHPSSVVVPVTYRGYYSSCFLSFPF